MLYLLNPNKKLFMLSSSQLNRYFSDGFLLVENLLSEEEVDQFLVSQDQNKNKNYDSYGLKRFVVDDSWSYLANHKKIVSIISELIDGDPRIVQTMYMNKQAKGGTGVALHQDTHYIKNEPNTLMACWIALSDTDQKNGGLCVVPGSHKRPLYKTEPPSDEKEHNRWVQNYKMRDEQGKEWVESMHSHQIIGLDPGEIQYLSVARGSGVFFTSMTIHGSFANKSSNRPRLAFATHYVKDGTWIYRQDIQDTIAVQI